MRAKTILLWAPPSLLVVALASWFGCATTGPSEPGLFVSPGHLSFLYDEDSKQLDISNLGGGTLSWSISESDDYDWVSCAPTSGTTSRRGSLVDVTIDWSLLGHDGAESGWLVVSSSAGADTIPVVASRPGTSIVSHEPGSLFIMGPFPGSSTFEIWNGGTGVLVWEVYEQGGGYDWLSYSPTTGHSSGEHDVVTVHITWSMFSPGETKYGYVYLRERFGSTADSVSITAWHAPLGRRWTPAG